MFTLTSVIKRILVGRKLRSDRLAHSLLPKRIALPVFASDAMSSVAYAPQEIFVTLSVLGLAAYSYAPWVAGLVCLVMMVVVASYRQNVHAYPSGGGDYEVATVNLGNHAGTTVAAALLVDYVLTVAVSTAAGVANIGSAVPFVGQHAVWFSVGIIILVAAINLRGVRESGAAFAVPVYLFIFSMLAMIVVGLLRWALGAPLVAESAQYDLQGTRDLTNLAIVFIIAKSFSSGSTALTGVEAISNGVPAFKKPKSKNAATTLALMGFIAVTMMGGMVALARITNVHIAEHPHTQLIGIPDGYYQQTLIAQVARPVFDGFPIGFYVVSFATGIILILACNTAFNGFPVLASILARDSYLPRQMRTRGDRLAFSNGILILASMAIVLVVVFGANVNSLIPLYTVGVFVSFTLSQAGMLRHWHRQLRTVVDRPRRRRMRRSQVVNTIGLVMTGAVLMIVIVTKFMAGAWIAIVAMTIFFVMMKAINRHYQRVGAETAADEDDFVLPSRVHGIVLVSKLHLPTMRALAYARGTRPDYLEAVTVNADQNETDRLAREWEDRGIPVPLKVIDSPYREITKPIIDYVQRVRSDTPRDLVTVFIPQYVVGTWHEHLLHNQYALRLKSRLLYLPGVMVTSVPWQAASAEAAERRLRNNPVEDPIQLTGQE